ncbi:MAG: cytidylyltransferase domain-containing protein [Armatimonadota bacterium]
MTSTRLPGKVLLDLAGSPVLSWQIRRLSLSTQIDDIVIATTTNACDDPIVEVARQAGVNYFRGDEHNVVDRFVGAAEKYEADVIVRLTADCPLSDPRLVDQVVSALIKRQHQVDYCANIINRTYPRGFDVEALFVDVLLRIQRLAITKQDREHVTLPPRDNRSHLFVRHSIEGDSDNSDLRVTLDCAEDLQLLRALAESYKSSFVGLSCNEVVSVLREHPEWAFVNSGHTTWEPSERQTT